MSQPKTQSRDTVTNTLWVWLRFLKRFKLSGNGSINQVKIWVIVNEGSWDPFSHTSTWCTWSELLIQKLVLQMRIHLPLLQASKNVLLIKVTHQAPFCSCCRERKGERDTYKGPFFPLFLDRCLKRDWWVRWLPSLCWCSNRQLLRIWAKYRLNFIEFSSTVALSNLWTVCLRHEQCPRLLRQDDTCADLVQSHCCLVLGIECLEHHFRGSWPHQWGSVAHPHLHI